MEYFKKICHRHKLLATTFSFQTSSKNCVLFLWHFISNNKTIKFKNSLKKTASDLCHNRYVFSVVRILLVKKKTMKKKKRKSEEDLEFLKFDFLCSIQCASLWKRWSRDVECGWNNKKKYNNEIYGFSSTILASVCTHSTQHFSCHLPQTTTPKG